MKIHLDSEFTYLPEIGKILVSIAVLSISGDGLSWQIQLVWEDVQFTDLVCSNLKDNDNINVALERGTEEWDEQISEEWVFPKHTYLGLFHTLRERLLKKNA